MSASAKLAVDLRPRLTGFRVIGYNPDLDAVTGRVVMVYTESIRRPERFGLNHLEVNLTLWVLVGYEDPKAADDALDKALEDVLGALQHVAWVNWTDAERGVFANRFHGYKVNLTAVAEITPED